MIQPCQGDSLENLSLIALSFTSILSFSFSDLMDALVIFKVKGLITQLGRKILLLPLESRNTNKFDYTLKLLLKI